MRYVLLLLAVSWAYAQNVTANAQNATANATRLLDLPAAQPIEYAIPDERFETCFRSFRHCVSVILKNDYGYDRSTESGVWFFLDAKTTGCKSILHRLLREERGKDAAIDAEDGKQVLHCILELPKPQAAEPEHPE